MLDNFECPICSHDDWFPFEEYLYSIDDGKNQKYTNKDSIKRKIRILGKALFKAKPQDKLVKCDHFSAYHNLRRSVLFNVWFPRKQEVKLTSIACRKCGFVCYSPRPEDNDISAKYEYLKGHGENPGAQPVQDQYAMKLNLERAERIFNYCNKHLARGKLSILDYGGGDGNIMSPFIRNNHECYIIDYNDCPVDGVVKLADDLSNYCTENKFHLIICSHVLEHVSDISVLIKRLRELLIPGGILYAEVPQEIWAGLRIDADPVTHINFFTLNSLQNLFSANGFKTIEVNQDVSNYGRTYMEVIWLIARSDQNKTGELLPPDTNAVLFPSLKSTTNRILGLVATPLLRKIKEWAKL